MYTTCRCADAGRSFLTVQLRLSCFIVVYTQFCGQDLEKKKKTLEKIEQTAAHMGRLT